MISNSGLPPSRTLEGVDLFVGIFLFALAPACAIMTALSLSVLKNPWGPLLLCPLGGCAFTAMHSLYLAHKERDRDAWKLVLARLAEGLETIEKLFCEAYRACRSGWMGMIDRVAATVVLLIVVLLRPFIIPTVSVFLAAFAFSLFIRGMRLILGA